MLHIYLFLCQFNVKSICVQINRLETDKQSDPKGCAAHAIYRLEAQWASVYANTMFAMEQSVQLLKISLIMVWISYPALSICCNMLGKRIEQFVSNTPGRHPITPAAKCIWQHPPVMTLYLPLIQIQNRKQSKEQQQQQQKENKPERFCLTWRTCTILTGSYRRGEQNATVVIRSSMQAFLCFSISSRLEAIRSVSPKSWQLCVAFRAQPS